VLMESHEFEVEQHKRRIQDLEANLEQQRDLVVSTLTAKKEVELKFAGMASQVAHLKEHVLLLETEKEGVTQLARDCHQDQLKLLEGEYIKHKSVLISEVSELKAAKKGMSSELTSLRAELEALRGKHLLLKGELGKHTGLYKAAVREHQEKAREVQDVLAAKFEGERAALAQKEANDRRMEELTSCMSEIVETHHCEILRYEEDLRAANELSQSLRELVDQQSETAQTAVMKAEALQDNLLDVSRQVGVLESSLRQEMRRGEADRQILQTRIEEQEQAVMKLSNERDDFIARLHSTGSCERQEYIDQISALEAEVMGRDAAIIRLEQEGAELRGLLDELEAEHAAINDVNKTLSQKLILANERQSVGEINELQQQLTGAQSDLEQFKSESAELRTQLADARLAKVEIEAALALVREEANNLSTAMSALLQKHRLSVSDQLKNITLSELERKSLQSILDEVQRGSNNSADVQENVLLISSYIDLLTRELSALKRSRVSAENTVEGGDSVQKQITEYSHTIDSLENTLLELKSELEATKTHENSLLVELRDIKQQYERTRNDLNEVQSQYSKIIIEHETSTLLSHESGMGVKRFPVITGASYDPSVDIDSFKEPGELKIHNNPQLVSPLSYSSLNRSPNKMGRRLTATDELTDTAISLPFKNASIMDFASTDARKPDDLNQQHQLNPSVTRIGPFPINMLGNIIKADSRLLIMCDMSSTMEKDDRLKVQRKCVYSIANASLEKNSWLGMSYWNSKLHFVSTVDDDGELITRHWRRGDQILSGFKALESVKPEGGNDMRTSLEVCFIFKY
jgi:chromosome segregation ATPase